MKGAPTKGVQGISGPSGKATPTRVGRGGNVTGITNKGQQHVSKSSIGACFVASRKKGSVKGSC